MNYWFKCPQCLVIGSINEDQLLGRVSILHDCGFHKTGTVKPPIPDTQLVNKDQEFVFEENK